jgi:hypothetical protein
MKLSKVHHCISQEMVVKGQEEPPAKKCICRKVIPYHEADAMVKRDAAAWIVVGRERGTHKVLCPLCRGDKEVKNCAQCGGEGTILRAVEWNTYGEDIVFVSSVSEDKEETKYRPTLAMKTPRVPTIESEHIEYAYVLENKDAATRIEEYGSLIQWALQEYGAAMIDARTKEPVIEGKQEPKNEVKSYPPGSITFKDGSKNKSWWTTVDGRDLDHGRAI